MSIPFTTEEFLQNFGHYNLAIWPAPIVAYVVGAIAVALAIWPIRHGGRLIAGALALLWIWTGVFYFVVFPLGGLSVVTVAFGVLFVVQGALLAIEGVFRARFSFRARARVLPLFGSAMVVYAMAIYPLLGVAAGHHYPRMPMFGVAPCPVDIFTFGLLLWTHSRVPRRALIIPALWSLLGVSAIVSYGMIEDVGLLVAGVVGTALILWRDRAAMSSPLSSTRARATTRSAPLPQG